MALICLNFIDAILWVPGLISSKNTYIYCPKFENCVGANSFDSVTLKRMHDIAKTIWLVLISRTFRDALGAWFVKKRFVHEGNGIATLRMF